MIFFNLPARRQVKNFQLFVRAECLGLGVIASAAQQSFRIEICHLEIALLRSQLTNEAVHL